MFGRRIKLKFAFAQNHKTEAGRPEDLNHRNIEIIEIYLGTQYKHKFAFA